MANVIPASNERIFWRNSIFLCYTGIVRRLHLPDFIHQGESCHFSRSEISVLQSVRDQGLHDHDFVEVFWVETGWGWHWVNDLKRKLDTGQLVLVCASDRHAIVGGDRQGIRIANVAFFRKTWNYVHRRYFPSAPDPFTLSEPEREFGSSGSFGLDVESLAGHFISHKRGIAQIEGFLLELGNAILTDRAAPSDDEMPDWLSRACRGIRAPEYLAGGTHAFALLAARSPDHVARETQRWLKKTPTEIVNDARMDYASVRLASSQEPIVNIAMECGLNNLAHFYLLFRNRFQTSPRQYRLRSRRIVGGVGK